MACPPGVSALLLGEQTVTPEWRLGRALHTGFLPLLTWTSERRVPSATALSCHSTTISGPRAQDSLCTRPRPSCLDHELWTRVLSLLLPQAHTQSRALQLPAGDSPGQAADFGAPGPSRRRALALQGQHCSGPDSRPLLRKDSNSAGGGLERGHGSTGLRETELPGRSKGPPCHSRPEH